jgi:hypothetical protein
MRLKAGSASANTIVRVLCGVVLHYPLLAGASTENTWRFRVYLDDREIGFHHFTLTRDGTDAELLSHARFDVTFLGIPLYRYRHENTEVWRSDCLQSIVSTTDENGAHYRLLGTADGAAFRVNTETGDSTLPACISSFAYWNKAFLDQDRLLHPQTGEFLDIEVRYLGEQTIEVRGHPTAAHHYRLSTDETGIDLWYSQEDRWLALSSTIRGDRQLRYIIE